MATHLRVVPEPVAPPARELVWTPVDGDRASQILAALTRKLDILELATNGLAHELRQADQYAPLRRYAAIAALTAEELGDDLQALQHALYGR